jgi:hypothetical protein
MRIRVSSIEMDNMQTEAEDVRFASDYALALDRSRDAAYGQERGRSMSEENPDLYT